MLSDWEGEPSFGSGVLFPHRTLPLHSMLIGCGHELRKTAGEYDLDGSKRGNSEFTIWQCTVAGEGALECDGASYRLKRGDALLIHVPQRHRYFLPRDSEFWEFIYVSVNGLEAMRVWYELERLKGPVAHFEDDAKSVAVASSIIRAAKAGEIKTPFQASSMAYSLLMAHFEDLVPYGEGGLEGNLMLKRVTDYCLSKVDSDISVDELSQVAGYSKFHFSRLFREACGMPPAAFLRNLRMKKSIRMLQMESGMTVKEIAAHCGFADESYFCKVFKKTFGSTPEAFRRGGLSA